MAEARRLTSEAAELKREAGSASATVLRDVVLAYDQAWFRGDSAGAVRALDAVLARTPLRSLAVHEAPYRDAVSTYAFAGRVDRARALLAEWEVQRRANPATRDTAAGSAMRGRVALAAGDIPAAQAQFRVTERVGCAVCELPMLARSYDLGGAPDSAIVIYERFLSTRYLDRVEADGMFLPAVHKRLGELYEAKGDRTRALAHYRAFIELWKNADPELQPKVTDARLRVAALTKGTDARR